MIHLISWLGKQAVSWPDEVISFLYWAMDIYITVMVVLVMWAIKNRYGRSR